MSLITTENLTKEEPTLKIKSQQNASKEESLIVKNEIKSFLIEKNSDKQQIDHKKLNKIKKMVEEENK